MLIEFIVNQKQFNILKEYKNLFDIDDKYNEISDNFYFKIKITEENFLILYNNIFYMGWENIQILKDNKILDSFLDLLFGLKVIRHHHLDIDGEEDICEWWGITRIKETTINVFFDYEFRLDELYPILNEQVYEDGSTINLKSGKYSIDIYRHNDKFRVQYLDSNNDEVMKHFKYPLDVIEFVAPMLYYDFSITINQSGIFEPLIILYNDITVPL